MARYVYASTGVPEQFHQMFTRKKSSMRTEVNGKNSCTGNQRPIDVRYFFNKKYQVEKYERSIVYCPTHIMLAEYITKPLQ